jgi:hypothetical protein
MALVVDLKALKNGSVAKEPGIWRKELLFIAAVAVCLIIAALIVRLGRSA